MTRPELAPAAFAALLTLAVAAMVMEMAVAVAARRGGVPPGLARMRRAARLVAPLALGGTGVLLAGLSLRGTGSTSGDAAPRAAPSPSVTITEDGIGAARAGMSRADVRAALPEEHRMGEAPAPFMVDLDGVPVTVDADTLYMLLYASGDPAGEDAPVALVATTSARARTGDGVGPGTSLAEARVRWGPPTLSYNVLDESREYARFPGQPSDRVLVRVTGADGERAGAYPPGGEYRETTAYDPGARITMVLVRLTP